MKTNIEAAKLLTMRAAKMKDDGLPNIKEAAMAKLFASEIAERQQVKLFRFMADMVSPKIILLKNISEM